MMRFKQILVVKETRQDEKRVALTPQAVAVLVSKGYRVLVEINAGIDAGFTNDEYKNAGAKIFLLTLSGFPPDTFIVRVLRPSNESELIENKLFNVNTAMLGFLFPFVADDHITTWQALGLTTLSFDLFKSLSIDDSKNAQAAMSRIAGRLAYYHAIKVYQGENPVRVSVIGTGAAGMSAAMEAIKNKVQVQLFGRKEERRVELEKMGIKYLVLPEVEKQISFIQSHLSEEAIIITAAREPGKKAPLLIDEKTLSLLPQKSVVVDLAISNGGNVAGSKHDQVIALANDILLINISGYPKTEAKVSSEIYADCVVNLLTAIMSKRGEVSFENKLIREIWVTHQKQRHESLYNEFEGHEKHNSCLRAKL